MLSYVVLHGVFVSNLQDFVTASTTLPARAARGVRTGSMVTLWSALLQTVNPVPAQQVPRVPWCPGPKRWSVQTAQLEPQVQALSIQSVWRFDIINNIAHDHDQL